VNSERAETLYREHAASVIRYCAFSTGSWADGEDIAAEVFTRLLTRTLPIADQAVAPWLFVVARNLCRSHHRKASRRRHLDLSAAESLVGLTDAWVDREVWEHLHSLKEDARLVIFLHVVEGRPFAEIARLRNSSLSAVKMTYYRALRRIRQRMSAEYEPGAVELLGGPSDV